MNQSLFWREETDLPPGSGYALFGTEHFLTLFFAALFICFCAAVFRRMNEKGRTLFLRITAVSLAGLDLLKILVLTGDGRMGIGHLPLHLCSMAVYLYPVIAFSRNRRVRGVLGEISACTLLPAGVSALLFPDWTMYPVISFMNLDGFVWHTLQVLLPLLLLLSGEIRPDIRHYWWNVAFLSALALPVWIFDSISGCNYWFLLRPVPGTPLETLFNAAGTVGYLPVLLITVSAVILAAYGIYGGLSWTDFHINSR